MSRGLQDRLVVLGRRAWPGPRMPAGCCIRRVGSWAGHVRQRVIAWNVVLAVSLAWGLAVAVGVYAFMRAVQVLLQPDPDPAQVVWSIHAGYVWRAWTAAYAG